MRISESEIADRLASGQHRSAHSISPQMIDRYIEKHRGSDQEIGLRDVRALKLRSLIEDNLRHFNPQIVDQLNASEIYIPPKLCMALSWKEEQRNIIVLGEALLDLLFATATWQLMVESLPEDLNSDQALKNDFAMLSFALLLRAYTHGEPIPDFEGSFDSTNFGRHRHLSFMSACLFVLFHELGHLNLHDGERQEAPEAIDLLVGETLEPFQLEEFEADAFVLDALAEKNYSTYQILVSSGLMFFATAENVLATHHAEHPLAMNRINYANYLVDREGTGPIDVNSYLTQQAQVFHRQVSKKNSPSWIGSIFDDEKYWQVVEDRFILAGKDLEAYGIDVPKILASHTAHWYECV